MLHFQNKINHASGGSVMLHAGDQALQDRGREGRDYRHGGTGSQVAASDRNKHHHLKPRMRFCIRTLLTTSEKPSLTPAAVGT